MNSPKATAAAGHLFIFRRLALAAFACVALAAGCLEARAGNPSEKDLRRGEEVVAELRRLERLAADSRGYRALAVKLYPALFVKVSKLKEGDLKTDLTTAVFLHEQALGAAGDVVDCAAELRAVYARLCAEEKSGGALRFLSAKARLHTNWADALIRARRGAADAATLAAIEEMRAERRIDLTLAEKALSALRTLGRETHVYSSLAQFQEGGALARVSFERLSEEAASALCEVDRILQSLPRGPLFYPLYHARNFYSDGLFWWRKTYRRRQPVVDVNSFAEPGDAESLGLNIETIEYTVSINWRNAAQRTRRAEELITKMRPR